MGLMMLAAGPGTTITIEARPARRRPRRCDALGALVAGRFGEEDWLSTGPSA